MKKKLIYHNLQDLIPGLNIIGFWLCALTAYLLVNSFQTRKLLTLATNLKKHHYTGRCYLLHIVFETF